MCIQCQADPSLCVPRIKAGRVQVKYAFWQRDRGVLYKEEANNTGSGTGWAFEPGVVSLCFVVGWIPCLHQALYL